MPSNTIWPLNQRREGGTFSPQMHAIPLENAGQCTGSEAVLQHTVFSLLMIAKHCFWLHHESTVTLMVVVNDQSKA